VKVSDWQRKKEIQIIKEYPISEFLAFRGYLPKQKTAKIWWYFSPFRQEKRPSFALYVERNDWYDYGESKGGSIIDLVMHLDGVSYIEAIQYLRKAIIESMP
jgi:DNA primase